MSLTTWEVSGDSMANLTSNSDFSALKHSSVNTLRPNDYSVSSGWILFHICNVSPSIHHTSSSDSPWSSKSFVGCCGDHISILKWTGNHLSGHQSRNVGHISQKIGPMLVTDLQS